MSTWRCIKTVVMSKDSPSEYTAFTEGKTYTATKGATPGGDRALCFQNDQGQDHLALGKWLHEHFELISTDQPTEGI